MLITIVTVCFNSASTLMDTLSSISTQSYKNFEHIVIDGGSNDGTLEMVQSWKGHSILLISESDEGIYDAMNKGFKCSRGDVVGFLNSDDFYADSDVLMRVVQAFESDPRIEACFGDLVYVSEDNSKVVRYWKSRPYEKGSFAHGWCPAHPTFYVLRAALNRLGQFDLTYRLAADAEFMMRYLERGGIHSLYIPHIQVRMRLGGVSNQSWRNIVRQNREILQAFKENRIAYSLPSFLLRKLLSRVWQRLAGFNMLK